MSLETWRSIGTVALVAAVFPWEVRAQSATVEEIVVTARTRSWEPETRRSSIPATWSRPTSSSPRLQPRLFPAREWRPA